MLIPKIKDTTLELEKTHDRLSKLTR